MPDILQSALGDLTLIAVAGMAAAIFAAALLRAFTGFGFALAALPVLSLFLKPTTSVSVIVMLTLTVSFLTFRSFAKHVPWRTMGTMVVLSAVGTFAGVYLLLIIDASTFKLAIGVTVMLACAVLTRFKPKDRKPGGWPAWGAGLASGLLNGALAIPGPPVIIYAMAAFHQPVLSRAFLMGFFLFSASFAGIGYAASGLITLREVTLYALGLPVMLLGERLGTFLFMRYGNAGYRKIAIAALFVIGATVTIAAI